MQKQPGLLQPVIAKVI